VAPFDAAAVVLAVGGVIIATSWSENYGDASGDSSAVEGFKKAGALIWRGAWLGVVLGWEWVGVEGRGGQQWTAPAAAVLSGIPWWLPPHQHPIILHFSSHLFICIYLCIQL
jgi:hypothetical protein